MADTFIIEAKQLGIRRRLFPDYAVPCPPEANRRDGRMTLRDFIEHVVREEVAAFRAPYRKTPRPPLTRFFSGLVARELAERDVFWMEEPLHRGDHQGMRMVREASAVRIAGGEMTRELHEFDLMLAAGCLDVYQPDAAVTGGIGGLSTLARRVGAAGHVFSPHTWGSGVALVANAHLCAGTVGAPYLEYPLDPPEWTEERRDFLLTEAVVADGRLVLSDDPGLGVRLDEERLAATRTERATYS